MRYSRLTFIYTAHCIIPSKYNYLILLLAWYPPRHFLVCLATLCFLPLYDLNLCVIKMLLYLNCLVMMFRMLSISKLTGGRGGGALKTAMPSWVPSLNIIFIIIIIIRLQSFQKEPRFRWVFVRPDKMDCKDKMATHLTLQSEGWFPLQRGKAC